MAKQSGRIVNTVKAAIVRGALSARACRGVCGPVGSDYAISAAMAKACDAEIPEELLAKNVISRAKRALYLLSPPRSVADQSVE